MLWVQVWEGQLQASRIEWCGNSPAFTAAKLFLVQLHVCGLGSSCVACAAGPGPWIATEDDVYFVVRLCRSLMLVLHHSVERP